MGYSQSLLSEVCEQRNQKTETRSIQPGCGEGMFQGHLRPNLCLVFVTNHLEPRINHLAVTQACALSGQLRQGLTTHLLECRVRAQAAPGPVILSSEAGLPVSPQV